jgi:uncharacterized protein YkwD
LSPVTRAGTPLRARILIVAVVTALTTVLTLIAPSGAQATTAVASYAEMMQRVVDDTNAVRADAGLRPLVRNADLDRVAAAWARQQWENGAMSHNPNFSTQIPSGWERAGENVAKGYTYTQVVPAWTASPGHYANIVNDYNSIGIGYYEQDGRRYWTQLFAKYPGVTQPAAAPAALPTQIPVPATTRTASPRTRTATSTSLTFSPEPGTPVGVAVRIDSASFESGTGSWITSSATVEGPNGLARGGLRSLVVSGAPSRTVTQTVSADVGAGSTHVFTVWVRADGAAAGTLRLRTLGGASTESSQVGFTASPSGWLRVSVSLTARAAHTGFRLDVLTPTAGRSYRLDSVSLVRTGAPLAAAPPATGSSVPAPAPGGPLIATITVPRPGSSG